MKIGLIVALSFVASPAFAHHEVIVATSIVPLVSAFIAIPIAGLAAWRRHRKK